MMLVNSLEVVLTHVGGTINSIKFNKFIHTTALYVYIIICFLKNKSFPHAKMCTIALDKKAF